MLLHFVTFRLAWLMQEPRGSRGAARKGLGSRDTLDQCMHTHTHIVVMCHTHSHLKSCVYAWGSSVVLNEDVTHSLTHLLAALVRLCLCHTQKGVCMHASTCMRVVNLAILQRKWLSEWLLQGCADREALQQQSTARGLEELWERRGRKSD